ncbi:MAG: efflux RND transporter periplasmic adaptor subunit [Rhodocyclaceae bacterium]|jgi:membrane fusion protein (multidrug efflux system)|nr:efflux RND transporter periplasmic adaptor subunit [Rhodocyclaceae bacterium]
MKKITSVMLPALLVVLAACGEGSKQGQPAGAAAPPPEVDVVTVAPSNAAVTRDLPGRITAVRVAQVRARVEGVVEKRLFVEGSDIRAGTPLFRIEPRVYEASLSAAEANLAAARATFERYRPLLEIKAVSQQEFDAAAAAVKQAEAALAKAKLDLENAVPTAPISGRIGRALVTEGALVGKGEATPLATIEQLDPVYVDFTESSTELLRLREAIKSGRKKRSDATRVALVLEDGRPYAHPGRLLFSDLSVDPATGSILMRAEFPNPDRELLPGMFARVRFPESVVSGAIVVPQRAVQMSPQGQFVTIVDKEGKAAPQPVKIGGMSGGDFIVTDGLKGGEQVIVNGLQKARPGMPVKPVPWAPAAAPAPTAKQGD